MEKVLLTIIIPTYNREKRLLNTLKKLESQTNKNFYLIIVDNSSDYDIEKMLKNNIGEELRKKIELRKNNVNIGMVGNLAKIMTLSKTEWLWTLSDDDEPMSNAVELIYKEIKEGNEKLGMISFEGTADDITTTQRGKKKETIIKDLKKLIDICYFRESKVKDLPLAFLSTGVYNVKLLTKYLNNSFTYANTYLPHCVPAILALYDKKIEFKFVSKALVKYIPPAGETWDGIKATLGLSTISHLPLELNKKDFGKLMELVTWFEPKSIFLWCIGKEEYFRRYYNLIYYNSYIYSYSFKRKITAFIFLKLLNFPLTYNSLKILKKVYKNYKLKEKK
ncbi:MAG: glycosyltransferase family 2 protein [Fusobacterium varium]|uniref:glycosyltransferase family 2 protein n=1 Tax=Fusobacterium varium TaxID=856 RepID=UPI0039962A7E